jgi:hypothetical protein
MNFRLGPNFFRKNFFRERKKLSWCFGFSFLFVPNIFYRYRSIEKNFYTSFLIGGS